MRIERRKCFDERVAGEDSWILLVQEQRQAVRLVAVVAVITAQGHVEAEDDHVHQPPRRNVAGAGGRRSAPCIHWVPSHLAPFPRCFIVFALLCCLRPEGAATSQPRATPWVSKATPWVSKATPWERWWLPRDRECAALEPDGQHQFGSLTGAFSRALISASVSGSSWSGSGGGLGRLSAGSRCAVRTAGCTSGSCDVGEPDRALGF